MIVYNNKKTFQLSDILCAAFILCATIRTLEPIPIIYVYFINIVRLVHIWLSVVLHFVIEFYNNMRLHVSTIHIIYICLVLYTMYLASIVSGPSPDTHDSRQIYTGIFTMRISLLNLLHLYTRLLYCI